MGENKEDQEKNKARGGVNISGDAKVTARDIVGGDKDVETEYDVAGDLNIVTIGAGAQAGQIAVGRGHTQMQGGASVESSEDTVSDALFELRGAFEEARPQLDPSTIPLVEFQLQLLEVELGKDESKEMPIGSVIIRAGDGLWSAAPVLRPAVKTFFSNPAVRRVVERAGVGDWASNTFG